jgi:hypothetical protein
LEGSFIKELLLFILKANCWQRACGLKKESLNGGEGESAIKKPPIKWDGREKEAGGDRWLKESVGLLR